MSYEFLTCEIDARGVATVTLNRPAIHNAFNDTLITEIRRVFTELDKDEECRMAILTGTGKSFCAGADLNWMKSMIDYNRKENYTDSKNLAHMFSTLDEFSKPLIGKVNGHALGGGVGLVCVCDYVIANKKSRFGFTEVRLGIIPAVISPYCIRKIGESNARAWFLSGEIFNSETAKDMHLIHEVCSIDELDEKTEEVIKRFLKAGPKAAVEAKKLISNVRNLPAADVEEYTLEAITYLRVSDEGQAGMKALLNKTKPFWIEDEN